ncbi:MAG: DUF5702 domain-containing protein [Lachnospiraceae bacterium]|nr:DUF5702 domain-containing protein [Lachnospiraceae bacterium]
MKKGYLTVFLSLTISIMLSLILALLYGARVGAIRMKTECATDISMNSVLAEYNRELFERYDLLLVDCSYQSETPSIANVEEHLKYFMNGNLDQSLYGKVTGARTMIAAECANASIPAYSFATDGEGAVLRRQILEYMKGEPIMDELAEASANLVILSNNGYDTHDVEAEAAENRERLGNVEIPTQIDENGEEYQPSADNPADAVESQKGIGVVSLAVPDPSAVSTKAVDLSPFASHRDNNRGTGLDESEALSVTDVLLINQYMVEKTGCFTRPREETVLKYQLEYLIGGKENDFDNLEHCARILLFWREASNFAYLINDSAKVTAVEVLAAATAALLMSPGLYEPLKWSVLFAWSFAESISDMRILYSGGRVPLIKTRETWRLSLEHLPFFREHLGEDGGSGLTYEDYLRMLLLLGDTEKKTMRMADLMEMDIRQTPGNGHFRLDWCLDVFEAQLTVNSRMGVSVDMVRTYGYEK